MVSNGKRMRYVSENFTSSEEDSYEERDYQSKKEVRSSIDSSSSNFSCKTSTFQNFNSMENPRRKPRCSSKNALMARENRLRKKMYVNKLEKEVTLLKNENKKLTAVTRNQSLLVVDLQKELKYLKSIIANSSDIKNLIRNIHNSTGMSVSSSLDSNLSLKNISVPKKNLANPDVFTTSDCLLGDDLSLNLNLYEDITDFPLLLPENNVFNGNNSTSSASLEEHNYTALRDNDEDVGVCLHVSKHKVSLEFCMNCSDKAQESWSQL